MENIHRYNINVREKKEPGEKSEDIMLLLLYFLQREHKMTLKLKKNRGIIVIKACFYNLPWVAGAPVEAVQPTSQVQIIGMAEADDGLGAGAGGWGGNKLGAEGCFW